MSTTAGIDPLNPDIQKETAPLILFDGICRFCSASVRWLIERDRQAVFYFAPIQSEVGRTRYQKLGLDPENIQTFVLIKDGTTYLKSDAALEILKILGGLWRITVLFRIIPRPLRDWVYDLIAKNRLHLMGRHQSCIIPSDDIRDRFL